MLFVFFTLDAKAIFLFSGQGGRIFNGQILDFIFLVEILVSMQSSIAGSLT